MILVGDIGGSNTRLALAEIHADGVGLSGREQFSNSTAASLAELINIYLAGKPRPDSACIAVAGPTDGRTVQLTNLDWHIDAGEISRAFGFPCHLINDFEAVAWGLDTLKTTDRVTLQTGPAIPDAVRVAIGPGTGLGIALSVTTRRSGYHALPGEGGHIGFAPTDEEQAALLRFLQEKHGRVSVERILSGPGIADLFAFCRTASGRTVTRQREPAEVTDAALAGSDPIALWAMRLFCRILGQTAGDVALLAGAKGGIYLAGGIPPRILPLLHGPEFLAGLRDKGRFSDWVGQVPVYLITAPDIGLKGAALAYSMPSRSTR